MQPQSWQQQLANAIRTPEQLLNHVGLDIDSLGYTKKGVAEFPVRVPLSFANRMQKENPDDPLLRQVFPYMAEDREDSAFTTDPLKEKDACVKPGLLHKYHDRVLTVSTGACAVHCRYCFRRHYPYEDADQSSSVWQQRFDYIRDNPQINEIILSGGDPLSLADHKLAEYCDIISEIKHIKRIRIHTRFPIVIPDRLTSQLIKLLSNLKQEVIVVLHINHANEIDETVSESLTRLNAMGLMLLNQSVLLNGVNNHVDDLIQLSERLIANKVTPYYLHLLDPVAGTTHYKVDELQAANLIKEMQTKVSGYLVPRLVKEVSGEKSKVLIDLG